MKNLLVLASLLLAVGYSLALAAQFVGLISFSVLSVPAFITAFTCSGLLAIALGDYSAQQRYDASPVCRTAARIKKVAPAAAVSTSSAWTYNTLSA